MGKRTFFALDIDEATRGRIVSAAERLQSLPGRITWTKPQNLHVTMNFLG
ncbi:MAG: RNA 2',3'-cyclic phosphodiesterase, partial [Planctomycetes bacterium]|nr:RNA 2',3'-cyclic phosphodiesterase [Planctomycetota bacterium]